MIAYLPPAIAMQVMKHCGSEGSPSRPNRREVDAELQHTRLNTTAVRARYRIVDERLTILGAHTQREPCLEWCRDDYDFHVRAADLSDGDILRDVRRSFLD